MRDMSTAYPRVPGSSRRRCIVPVARLAELGQRPRAPRAVNTAAPPPSSIPRAAATDRYRLGRRLGVGGTAEVFEAALNGADGFTKTVAVKRILPGLASNAHYMAMWFEEARLAARFSHPNVVSALDFGRDEEGRPFIVLEYVAGVDLARLAEAGPVPYSVAAFIAAEMLSGLGYVHDLPEDGSVPGLVHRDLTPRNVLLSWTGAVKIADFGLAKAREGFAVPASWLARGTPGYISPEQVNGEELDGRSDLFTVGVVLWELLAGRRLFAGTSREAIAQMLFRPVERPSAYRPDVPDDIERVAMRLLELARAARYAKADLVLDDLARCRDAPRNGRVELARLLAECFSRTGSSSPQLQGSHVSTDARHDDSVVTVTNTPRPHQAPPPWPLWIDASEPDAYLSSRTRRLLRALAVILALMIALSLALLFGR